jgi:hypothetical protein
MRKGIFILFCAAAAMIVLSCKKITNPTPGPSVIAFKSFDIVSETEAYFHFTFTDPDGDIGLKSSDTSGAFAHGSEYYNDFHMRFQFKNYQGNFIDSVWIDPNNFVNPADSGLILYRIPYVDNKSKDKSLTGEVIIKLAGFRPTSDKKNFRYHFYIYDRAHHKSNVVTTPEFYFP